jgi:hypothetical protein
MASFLCVLVLCALIQQAVAEVDYAKALDVIHETTDLLYQRYEFNRPDTYQFFLEVSNMPPYGWDQMKFKIAQKMLDGTPYTMIFGGSSVTAGHDNYYHQAHPFVFERRIKPLLALIGVDLVVRNIAQGANNCRPFEYCYESMGGEGADFIQWEQSFNCGRDKSTFEYMARYAAWNNATLYYMASGGWIPSGCKTTQVRPVLLLSCYPVIFLSYDSLVILLSAACCLLMVPASSYSPINLSSTTHHTPYTIGAKNAHGGGLDAR